MIYPINQLVRQEILAGGSYEFIAETVIPVRFVADAFITFHNRETTNARFRVIYTCSQSNVFSDSFTVVDEAVAAGNIYSYEFKVPLVQTSSHTVHSIRMTNNDTVDQTLYCLITGWTDTKVTQPGTVFAIGAVP